MFNLKKDLEPDFNIFKDQWATSNHASWIYEYELNGEIFYDHNDGMACYADMRSNKYHMDGVTLRKIYNCVRCKENMRGIAKDFWEFLTDPKISPHRNVIKDGVELVKEGNIEYWVFPVDNNMSSQTLVSLFIALREVNEYPNFPRLWHYLVDKGWDKVEALYAGSHFFLNNKNKITMGNSANHHMFSTYGNNSLKRLKEGDPLVNKEHTLITTYGHIQAIWTTDGKDHYVGDQIPPIYNKLKFNKGYTGQFKKVFNTANVDGNIHLMKFPKPEEFAKMRDLLIV